MTSPVKWCGLLDRAVCELFGCEEPCCLSMQYRNDLGTSAPASGVTQHLPIRVTITAAMVNEVAPVTSWVAQARLQKQVLQVAAHPKPLPLPDAGCAFFFSMPLRFFDAAAGGAACSLSVARACILSAMRSW